GAQRLPPGSCGQFLEQALPEIVRTCQDGNGFRCRCRCRVIPLEPAGRSLHSQPLRLPFRSVVFDKVPQSPGDSREGRVTGPVRLISPLVTGLCPPDRTAAGHWLPEVFVVGEPGEPTPGPLVHVIRQLNDVSAGVTLVLHGKDARTPCGQFPSSIWARLKMCSSRCRLCYWRGRRLHPAEVPQAIK